MRFFCGHYSLFRKSSNPIFIVAWYVDYASGAFINATRLVIHAETLFLGESAMQRDVANFARHLSANVKIPLTEQ